MAQDKVIVVIHRFGDYILGGFVNYNRVIDHSEHRVVYFVNARGHQDINAYKDQAAAIYEFPDLEDYAALEDAAKEVIESYGIIDYIIAMSEYDLIQAAKLRTKFGIPGTSEQKIALYRNKIVMKERLQSDGLRVPNFLDYETVEDAISFAEKAGFPLILKPKLGAASKGVLRVSNWEELIQSLTAIERANETANYQCEEFVNGPIFHIDGLVRHGQLKFITVSQYVNGCLAFSQGLPNGSFIITDRTELKNRMTLFTEDVLRALELRDGCFHLEVIDREGVEAVFLEIGARMGGAETPFLTLELYGVNLCEEWIKIELGTFTELDVPQTGIHGGLLQFPEPPCVPAEVISVTSIIDRVPEIFHERIPEPGEIMDGSGSYYHISGRYMFRGESEAKVEQAIHWAIELFRIEARPLEPMKA
ncbi:ATP-grasp domain-containing protein [Paenibacillus sp. sptzw28]|uniref:ATP-grasp domain-containing protein n=1 Tax=Paenibacillus sp. sptzw28 TaxID=715179 RepID=UPI001C6F5024|nr:ATP-grasp domain-containing protein [Paenibacillus sp. sptzw28]QYR23493.1 ATP-grasp domain-containing protein [Paenibacillus sp. sptzw28]